MDRCLPSNCGFSREQAWQVCCLWSKELRIAFYHYCKSHNSSGKILEIIQWWSEVTITIYCMSGPWVVFAKYKLSMIVEGAQCKDIPKLHRMCLIYLHWMSFGMYLGYDIHLWHCITLGFGLLLAGIRLVHFPTGPPALQSPSINALYESTLLREMAAHHWSV